MVDVEDADIDACAAQQVPLVLVEMAERRIEVGARDHAARIGKLREDGADHGGDFGVGAARDHLGEGKEMLFLLRVEPCGEAGRDLLLHVLTEGKEGAVQPDRSEEHTSELQSLMRISYAVFCLKKQITENIPNTRCKQ